MSKVWEHERLSDRYNPPEKSEACQMIYGQTVKILLLSVRPVIHRKLNDGVVDIV